MRIGKWSVLGAAAALLVVAPTIVCAQGNATPRQGRRGGRGGGARALTLAAVPPEALNAELKLSSSQMTQITQIHDQYTAARRSLRPAPGSPPDPNSREQMRTLGQQTSSKIEAVLSSSQKAALPQAMKELGLLRTSGIPLQAVGELNLTNDQKKQLKDNAQAVMQQVRAASPDQRRAVMQQARQDLRAKTMSILTDAQKTIVAKYGRRGRRGGQGGGNPSA